MKGDLITIYTADRTASASFAPDHGGIGFSLRLPVNGQTVELLYCRKNFWQRREDTGGLPFLFPVCGRHTLADNRNSYTWEGVRREMPLHGFGMRKPWNIVSALNDKIVMQLSDDEQTRAMYPFEFTVELEYTIAANQLTCRQRYTNKCDRPMPVCAGFHPYFQLPGQTEGVQIEGNIRQLGRYSADFTYVESWQDSDAVSDPLVMAAMQYVAELDQPWFVCLKSKNEPYVVISSLNEPDSLSFNYMQFFRSGSDPFICMEPWMGLPNALNEPQRVKLIPPGHTFTSGFAISTGPVN